MNDIPYSKETLQKQLKWLEESERIDDEARSSRCPICGGELELSIIRGGGDSIVYPYIGICKCTRCDMFKKEIKRDSQQSYLWKRDGSDEIALKRETWEAVKNYVTKLK